MALIKCPECGKEISDKANSCLSCGCPINRNESSTRYGIKTKVKICEASGMIVGSMSDL